MILEQPSLPRIYTLFLMVKFKVHNFCRLGLLAFYEFMNLSFVCSYEQLHVDWQVESELSHLSKS